MPKSKQYLGDIPKFCIIQNTKVPTEELNLKCLLKFKTRFDCQI